MFKIPRLKYPTSLCFEPIQLCNAQCSMCPYTTLQHEEGYRGKSMSTDQINSILDQFGYLIKKFKFEDEALIIPYRYSDPLITKNLENIFIKAKKYNYKVQITTNAVSLKKEKVKILNEYRNYLAEKIRISIIGTNQFEVQKYMKIDLNKTIINLKNVSENFPELVSKFEIPIRGCNETKNDSENIKKLIEKINRMGFAAHPVSNWLVNRISGEDTKIGEKNFVSGCKLFKYKVLKRMEIMVDGSVVLCCDDAYGHEKYGNVFENNIEKIWNSTLYEKHKDIFSEKFEDKKKNLFCNKCSRATFNKRPYSNLKAISNFGIKNYIKKSFKNEIDYL
jgi:hypothetical protein